MLWLQTPAWGRRLAALALAGIAVFVEFSPSSSADHPFLTSDVVAGDEIGDWNTDMRQVPEGVFGEVSLPAVAGQPINAGEPLLASMLGGAEDLVPPGWLVLEIELPPSATRGSSAKLVLVNTGDIFDAVVVSVSGESALGATRGEVAVEDRAAGAVAGAVARGDALALIETR